MFLTLNAGGQNLNNVQINKETQPFIYGKNSVILSRQFGTTYEITGKIYKNLYLGANISFTKADADSVPKRWQNVVNKDSYRTAGISIGYLIHTQSKRVKFLINFNPYIGKKRYTTDFKATFHPGSSGIDVNSGNFVVDLFFGWITSSKSRYTYEYNVKSIKYMGARFQPELLINFNKKIGCSLAVSYDYSKSQNLFTGEFGLIFGALSHAD